MSRKDEIGLALSHMTKAERATALLCVALRLAELNWKPTHRSRTNPTDDFNWQAALRRQLGRTATVRLRK